MSKSTPAESTPAESSLALDKHGGWKSALTQLSQGADLTLDQSIAAMQDILSGGAGPIRVAGLVMAIKAKGEADEELQGFAEAMMGAAVPLHLPARTLDIVGTGGSVHRQKHALNVSTMACFVAAAGGARVCKHGSVSASSTSGSFDFLSSLGVDINITPEQLQDQVNNNGLGFAFAKAFHPAFRHAAPVRTELGIQTIFNLLGPLAHPGRAMFQVVGASTLERAHQLARVLHRRGIGRAWVVCGEGGLDELTTAGTTSVFDVTEEEITQFEITPEEVGLERVELQNLTGGSPADNVQLFQTLLDGAPGPVRDIVCLSAGAGLVVVGVAETLEEGVSIAGDAIDSGGAGEKLAELVG